MNVSVLGVIPRLLVTLLLSHCLVAAPAMAGALVVGVSPDYKPLVFKRNGKLAGIEPDNAREVASIMGRSVRFVELGFDELLPALQDGKVDVVMSGISVTEERKQKVDFSRPFMSVGQMAIIRSADISKFSFPRAIFRPGLKVGVEPGTTGAQYVSEAMPLVTTLYFDGSPAAFAALRAKKIDVYIHDAPTSWGLADTGGDSDLFSLYRLLTHEELAWGVRRGNSSLLAELNAAHDSLASAGKLQAIQNFWIPVKIEVE